LLSLSPRWWQSAGPDFLGSPQDFGEPEVGLGTADWFTRFLLIQRIGSQNPRPVLGLISRMIFRKPNSSCNGYLIQKGFKIKKNSCLAQ
jgi:hypothetical protein